MAIQVVKIKADSNTFNIQGDISCAHNMYTIYTVYAHDVSTFVVCIFF